MKSKKNENIKTISDDEIAKDWNIWGKVMNEGE